MPDSPWVQTDTPTTDPAAVNTLMHRAGHGLRRAGDHAGHEHIECRALASQAAMPAERLAAP